MAFTKYPAVDENNLFPKPVMDALASSPELTEAFGGSSSIEPTELGNSNLDSVTKAGFYSQSFSGSASTDLNYPRGVAGRLLVQANESGSQVSQTYWTFDANENFGLYTRNFYSTWSPWLNLISDESGNSSDIVYKGALSSGTDVNTLTEPGIYTVESVSIANTLLNYPTKRGGIIQVWANPNSGVTSQDVLAHVSSTAPNERYTRTKLLSSNTTWSPWSTPEWIKGRLGSKEAPVSADNFRTIGAWVVAVSGDVTGLPGTGQGVLEVVFITTAGLSLQRFTERVANDQVVVWNRYSILVSGWSGVAWSKSGGSSSGDPLSIRESDVHISDHATRVEYEASRRGGSIGTNGMPIFMWRFDHWLVAFRDKILPILREFNLPGTLNVNYDNLSNEQNGGGTITWSQIQSWNQFYGIEIANHGATHTNANTMESIFHEVVVGRRALEKAMPLTPVVSWQEHGSAYLVAGDLDGDTGLDLGRSLEAFTESYAGRLVMAEHAVVEGKIGGFYQPITGRPSIGASHFSMDRDTTAEAIDTIAYGQSLKRALTGYVHPGLMDMANIDGSLYTITRNSNGSASINHPNNSTTNFASEAELRSYVTARNGIVHMSTKDFREVCAWLANERDQGRLMVMTSAGGAFADINHDRRENVFIDNSWAGSGWTVNATNGSFTATSGSSASTLSQNMLMYSRFGWAMGAAHELLVWAKAGSNTTIAISLEATNASEYVGSWKTEKTFNVTGDNTLRPYRLNLTIPRSASGLQMSAKITGSNLTIENSPKLVAI